MNWLTEGCFVQEKNAIMAGKQELGTFKGAGVFTLFLNGYLDNSLKTMIDSSVIPNY